jgi:hypothetical protein
MIEGRSNAPPSLPSITPQMQVELGCLPPGGDGRSITRITILRAQDDRGNLLMPLEQPHPIDHEPGAFPDERIAAIRFPVPRPGARTLSIQGEVMGYRRIRPQRIEIPAPAEGTTLRKAVGETQFVVTASQRIAKPKPETGVAAPDLPPISGIDHSERWGISYRAQITFPASLLDRAARSGQYFSVPIAAGASGRPYLGDGSGGPMHADAVQAVCDTEWRFYVDEPLVRLAWNAIEPASEERLCSFRLEGIPLPPRPDFVPTSATPGAGPTSGGPGIEEFRQEKGGSLVMRVILGAQKVTQGALSIGLAVPAGPGWSVARWTQLPIEPDGTARLNDLRPRKYRLLRAYHPRDLQAPVLPPGRWSGADVTVNITQGGDTVAPPLVWGPPGPAATTDRGHPPPARGKRGMP